MCTTVFFRGLWNGRDRGWRVRCAGVCFSSGGHLELVHARETGYLFPAGDVAGCAAVLTEALTNRKATRQMAQNFRECILSRYTWAACAGAYLRLLEG